MGLPRKQLLWVDHHISLVILTASSSNGFPKGETEVSEGSLSLRSASSRQGGGTLSTVVPRSKASFGELQMMPQDCVEIAGVAIGRWVAASFVRG